MDELTPIEARRVVVARQGFASRYCVASEQDVCEAIARLGCVQIDSVSTVARAHRLTLASRIGRIPAGTLNGLRRTGRIAEVWAHEASLIVADDLPWFRAGMVAETEHRWWGPVLTEHRRLGREVLRRIEVEGPADAAVFGGAGRPGWWEWSAAKRVLEALFSSGRLAVRERRGFTRVYDLPERLYTPAQLAPIEDRDRVLRWRVERAARARGCITERRVHDYFRSAGGARAVRGAVHDLVDAGALVRVRVGDHVCLADPSALSSSGRRMTAEVLLCPFDNMIWDRVETERLFGFRHALEIYIPAAKRRYGYYVLPLLVRDRLVGRVDVVADRRAGVLRAKSVHWDGRPSPAALRRAHVRLARTLGLAPE